MMTPEFEKMIRDDFDHYTDQYGLVGSDPGQSSGNGLRYTSEKLLIYKGLGILNDTDINIYMASVEASFVRDEKGERIRGLLNRSPVDLSGQAWDDYYGVMTASYVCQLPFARDIYNYGSQNAWCFNNLKPGYFSPPFWFGRSFSFLAHLNFCCRRYTGVILRNAWNIAMLTSGRGSVKDQDARVMSSFMLRTRPEWASYPLNVRSAELWKKRFMKDYPGGLSQVYSDYFQNPDHPLVKYSGTGFDL